MTRDSRQQKSEVVEGALRGLLRVYLGVTGLSQRDFAARSSVPQAAISRFLAGSSLGDSNFEKVRATVSPAERSDVGLASHVAWAFRSVQTMRDTDVLPRPPEFGLLAHTPVPIVAALGEIDLAHHVPRGARTFVAPKITGGFRVVTQLDPTDTLMYAALVHSIAPKIEASRASANQVFSFRFKQGDESLFWRKDVGWRDFVARGKALAQEESSPFVLVADVTDFYSQIGIATVVEALEDAGVAGGEAQTTGRMLSAIAGRRGRGLPVGPHPSALLAEAVLGRVDRHLERSGRPFVRYVDDIRIFCCSERDARAAWHDLAAFLADRLGLSLNDSKTRVDTSEDFAASEDAACYTEPQESGDDASHDKYVSPDQNPYMRELHRFYQRDFAEALSTQGGPLPGVRRLLRKAPPTSLDALLLDQAILPRLVPVMRELSLYLLKDRPPTDDVAARILWLAEGSTWADVPFVKLWVAEVLATRFADCCGPTFEAFLRRAEPDIGLAAAAVLAVAKGDREWVRDQEKRWESLSPWDRRAVLSAVKVLAPPERERWASRAEEHAAQDPLLMVLAHEIRAGDVPNAAPKTELEIDW